MKAQLTVPERPAVVHLLAILDVLVLLLVFFVVITNVAREAGVSVVSLPGSEFRLRQYGPKVVVTARGGAVPSVYVNLKRVQMEGFDEALQAAVNENGAETMLLLADKMLPVAMERRIIEVGLQQELNVMLVGSRSVGDELPAKGPQHLKFLIRSPMNKKPSRRARRGQEDREIGLSFAWRVPGGSFGRTLFGVLVTTVLFAGAASVLHVRVPYQSVPVRAAGQVIALEDGDELSRELLDWARFHSPFPDRWDPPGTGTLAARMAMVEAGLAASCAYKPRLLPMIEEEESYPLPGLVDLELFPLPETTVEPAILVKSEVAAKVDAVAVARGPLRERWGTARFAWPTENRSALVGIEASFTVGVQPDGRVEFCLVLDGAGTEVDEPLAAWLRQTRLAPNPEAREMVLDVVNVRFEAAPLEREEEVR